MIQQLIEKEAQVFARRIAMLLLGMDRVETPTALPKPATFRRAAPPKPRRKKYSRRDPRELERLQIAVRASIVKNPGVGAIALAKLLGCKTPDLTHPLRELKRKKLIAQKGSRGGAKYYPPK